MASRERTFAEALLTVLASLTIAFFIWFIAKRGDVETSDLQVELKLEHVSPYVAARLSRRFALISIEHPKSQKSFITQANFEMVVSLADTGVKVGVEADEDFPLELNSEMVRVLPHVPDAAVRSVQIREPSQVVVTARWRLKHAILEPTLDGQPALNYELSGPVELEPPWIYVTGTDKQLEQAPRNQEGRILLPTAKIDLRGLSKSSAGAVELLLPEALHRFNERERRLARDNEKTVNYRVPVAEKRDTRTFAELPVSLVTLSKKVETTIAPPAVKVVVTAPVTLLDQIQAEHIVIRAATLLEDDKKFSGEVAIEAVWSADAPEALTAVAELSAPQPKAVHVQLTPIVEEN